MDMTPMFLLQNRREILMSVLALMIAGYFSGCGIWEANLYPDHQSTRADYICHPYGDCSYGHWTPLDPLKTDQADSAASYALCSQEIDRGHENVWWKDSATRGLDIGECMEQLGFRLQQ